MSSSKLVALLLLGMAASIVVHALLFLLPAGRNWEVIPEMTRSPAVESYSESRLLANGMSQQMPPDGTVARGHLPFTYGSGDEEAVRAGEELRMPLVPLGGAEAGEGRKLFETFCTPCHGLEGKGDGIVPQRGFPAPPSLQAQHARELPDGRLFHIVTRGQKNMPSYAFALSPEERWEVIRYVRELQQGGEK